MWYKYLRSLLLTGFLLHAGPSTGQAPLCDDAAAIDSAISWISRTYNYTGQGWQDACDSLLHICPDLDRVWQMKAMPAVKMGDWHGCFSNLVHAIYINPRRWLPYQAFLKCMFTKDYAGALQDFRRCDTLVAGGGLMDHSYDFFQGLCCLGLKDSAGAYHHLKKDIDRQEQYRGKEHVHYVSLYYWGMYHFLYGAYAEAEAAFRRSLKVFPQYPEPSYYLGMAMKAQGRSNEALACFRTARESLLAGYNSNEDQEIYVNFPYAIGLAEVEEQLAGVR
jgi:tetratricopeptide (TPR) repeat protein